jgi:hypothetical protein
MPTLVYKNLVKSQHFYFHQTSCHFLKQKYVGVNQCIGNVIPPESQNYVALWILPAVTLQILNYYRKICRGWHLCI